MVVVVDCAKGHRDAVGAVVIGIASTRGEHDRGRLAGALVLVEPIFERFAPEVVGGESVLVSMKDDERDGARGLTVARVNAQEA